MINKHKILYANKNWREMNKDKILQRDMRRRAIKKGATVNLGHIMEWMKTIKSKKKFKCYYCDSVFPISSIHFDHIVPLSKGGPHSVENLCTSCAPCNLSKKAKMVESWIRIGQQVMSL